MLPSSALQPLHGSSNRYRILYKRSDSLSQGGIGSRKGRGPTIVGRTAGDRLSLRFLYLLELPVEDFRLHLCQLAEVLVEEVSRDLLCGEEFHAAVLC